MIELTPYKVLHGLGILFFFQAEDGIRDLVRSRGLGDVYKRQHKYHISETLCHNNFVAKPILAGYIKCVIIDLIADL